MSSSKSSPTNTTQTATTVSTQNLNASGNTGPTSVGGGTVTSNSGNTTNTNVDLNTDNHSVNYTITQTSDSGAVAAGQAIASAGLATTNHAIDLTSQVAGESTGLAQAALDTSLALNQSSNNFAEQLVSQFSTGLEALQSQQQTQLGNTVSALAEISRQQSESGNQQVIDAVTATQGSLQTIVKYVAIAVTVGAIAYLVLKKG